MNVLGRGNLSADQGSEVVRRLQQWVAGVYSIDDDPHVDTAVLENAADAAVLSDIRDIVTNATLLLSRSRFDTTAMSAWCVEYEGSAAENGAELTIDGTFFVQIQDYVSSAFLPIAGPAIVRVCSDDDYTAFLDDADIACRSGVFPEHLTHPLVQLGDVCALGSSVPCAAPKLRRLYINELGEVRSAPGGIALGAVTSKDPQAWSARANDLLTTGVDPCLAGVVSGERLRESRSSRPWLARYLWALEARRQLAGRGVRNVKVSGFGGRIVDGLESLGIPVDAGAESPAAPVLLTAGDDSYVFVPAGARLFKVGADAARLVEIASLAPSPDVARRGAAAHLGVSLDVATKAFDQVISRFFCYGVEVSGVDIVGVR